MTKKKNKSVLLEFVVAESVVTIDGRRYLKRGDDLLLLLPDKGKCINHPLEKSEFGTLLCIKCLVKGGHSIGKCVECSKKVSQRALRCKPCAKARFNRIIKRNNYLLRVAKMKAKRIKVKKFIYRDFSDLEET